jgi:acetyl-CoA C-acetyltransferase
MVTIDPQTPVIVGVGQITDRPTPTAIYVERPTPLGLMVEALRRAGADSGSDIVHHLDELVAIGSFTWHTADPALLVAAELGISPQRTRLTPTGGNLAQKLVHESARRIQAGEIRAVAVVGSEAMHASSLARREGVPTNWFKQSEDVVAPPLVEEDRIPFTMEEYTNGLTSPIDVYPLFENARRARLGWTLSEQTERIGTLWAQFAQVAAANPYAWITTPPSAEEITTPSASNRMIASPYTKLLVANMPVDMGAAYIITSYEHAVSLGVESDRLVFPLAGAEANDHWFISERPELDASPAMSAIWRALRDFGAHVDELQQIDIYSCFPTVVQTAADVLGLNPIDPTRPLTLTGGLTFGGGPGNNYVTHSIATMVDRLREAPSDAGLVTGLGWFSTKHAWGTYSATPPTTPFQSRSVQSEVDALPVTSIRQEDGTATVETFTVIHGRDGSPDRVVVAARWADGARVWAKSTAPDLMESFLGAERAGTACTIADGILVA